METSKDKYLKIKEFGLSQGLPKIPHRLYSRLEKSYHQYLKFAGILVANFEEVKIQEHREKYKHLYSGLREGFPIFDEENCLQYMNLVSGISKKYCAIYMYLDYVETVASGLLDQSQATWKELIEHQLSFTQKVIQKEEEEKTQKKISDSNISKATTYQSILGKTGSGKSIVMFPFAAKQNQIKIRYKKNS